ncbi:ATP-binding protein [Euzebya sp.]|uniref:AAA family ATPase n=1 Tax=Euzebya sp. TaxID=1971409 RepID=UPI0035128F90
MPKFVNREQELRALERACGPGMAVVSGRRRVGKTALLDAFAGSRRAIFLPGTRAPVAEAMRRLEERVRTVAPPQPGDLLDLGHLESWDAALGYLLARAAEEPLLLVLDEFPYLCETDPSLPSTLQARWDHRGDSQLSIILAGSHVGLMEELVASDAPLFGRPDMHLRLQPFSWRHAPLLVGGEDPEVWLEAFVTVGGMPRYLALWDPRHDAAANLAAMLDGAGAPLGDEGTVVLQELTPGSAAARVLELVALGAGSFTAIRDRAGLAPATTSEALSALERLGLLDRLTPVGEDPRRTKRVRYQVRDPFLRLWLGVVLPHRDAFELGRGGAVLRRAADRIAASQASALRGVVADWLADRTGVACGEWWGGPGEDDVDVMAVEGPHVLHAVSCHWAAGVEGRVWADRIRQALERRPEEVDVVARSGSGVLTPAALYADGGSG